MINGEDRTFSSKWPVIKTLFNKEYARTTSTQGCDWGIFKKPDVNMKPPVGPIIVGTERTFLFLSLSRSLENVFPKKGKYSIVNKSTAFAPSCHPYLNPLFFTLFFTRISAKKILKGFFRKNGRIHACPLHKKWSFLLRISSVSKCDQIHSFFA